MTMPQNAAPAMPTHERVNTMQLAEGDVVRSAGMRIRLGARDEYQDRGRTVVWFPGTVLNRDELISPVNGDVVWPLTGLLRTTGERAWTWTVQGNELAVWSRETATR